MPRRNSRRPEPQQLTATVPTGWMAVRAVAASWLLEPEIFCSRLPLRNSEFSHFLLAEWSRS